MMNLFSWMKWETIPKTVSPTATTLPRLSYCGTNLQGIGSRSQQEDAFGFVNIFDVTKIQEMGMLAIVADGMGGMQGGKFASETAVSTLKNDFCQMNPQYPYTQQLLKSARNASERIFQRLDGTGGSTLVACIIYQEQLYYVSVGDSFLYLKRNGELYRINREQNILHQCYRKAIQNGEISLTNEYDTNDEPNALTSFLGMEHLEDLDYFINPLPVRHGDVLLLCSDGVGGVLTNEQILKALECSTPQESCAVLEQNILMANKAYQDNYTALVIQCAY